MKINKKKVQHLMVDKEMNFKQLAEGAGVTMSCIQSSFTRNCKASTLLGIAKTLEVPAESIVVED